MQKQKLKVKEFFVKLLGLDRLRIFFQFLTHKRQPVKATKTAEPAPASPQPDLYTQAQITAADTKPSSSIAQPPGRTPNHDDILAIAKRLQRQPPTRPQTLSPQPV